MKKDKVVLVAHNVSAVIGSIALVVGALAIGRWPTIAFMAVSEETAGGDCAWCESLEQARAAGYADGKEAGRNQAMDEMRA